MIKNMPELIDVGIYDSTLIHKNEKSTKERFVNTFEFEFASEDGGTTYINDTPYKIRKNNVICAKPGQLRHTELPYRCLFLHINIDDKELAERINSVPDVFYPQRLEEYFNLFTAAVLNAKSKENTDIKQLIIVFELLTLFFKEKGTADPAKRPAHNRELIKKAVKFINENLDKNISVCDVAAHVHLSKIYFHNIFLSAMGTTPHQYICRKKMSLAKKLLILSDKSIADIANECGFSSQSYFSYVFKREYNISPKMYIKQMSLDWEK